METYILAIDQGTTSTRAILFDHNQEVVKIAQKEFTQYFPKPGWVEQDANEIWLTTLSVLSEVITEANIEPNQVEAIGITNQRETTVLWDKNTGIPVYHAIVWQSRQSDEICNRLLDEGKNDMIASKTGLRIDPYFSATKIMWMQENVPGLKDKIEHGDILFGTIDSWLVWKLSGNKTHITDVSNASRTLMYNIFEQKWDDELLSIYGINKNILPEVKPSSYMYAKTSPLVFFNEEVPICSVIGDQQAALFGQGCFSSGSVKNTYGTGGFLLMNTGDTPITSNNGLLTTIAWDVNGKLQYALEGSIFVSGSLIQWLRDGLQIFEKASESETLARSVEDNGGVVIVPAFVGLGAPYWNEKCRGSIFGITRGTQKGHIARAALESMAYQSRDLIEAMCNDCQMELSSLKVDGGAISNTLLLQFQSDLLQIPVEHLNVKETTALGAALLAGLAVGYWKEEDLVFEVEKKVVPQKGKEEMDALYAKWKKAVHACMEF